MKLALENCYMLARRKRTIVHEYKKDVNGKEIAIPIGPKSTDTDWDNIIRFCEQAGLKQSIVRTV
jgi:hypothetical protein